MRMQIERHLPAFSIVLRADARPRDELSGGGKTVHVAADLCKDDAGEKLCDARNAEQNRN